MLFLESPSHLFECFAPKLRNKGLWAPHPTFPLLCSEDGRIKVALKDKHTLKTYFNKKSWEYPFYINIELKEMSLSQKERRGARIFNTPLQIYQAFNGRCIKVIRLNNNPYDNRIENLMDTKKMSREDYIIWRGKRDLFIQRTIEYMVSKNKPIYYWSNIVSEDLLKLYNKTFMTV